MSRRSCGEGGFTLLELLVVIGLIAGFSVVLAAGLAGGSRTLALGSAQSLVANFVTAARTQALASGKTTRLLVNNNPANREGYRRQLVLVEMNDSSLVALHSATLPNGVYVLPNPARIPPGMYGEPGDWMKADGAGVLGSSSLASDPLSQIFVHEAGTAEEWEYIGFTARGTTTPNQGSIVIGIGRATPAGEGSANASPVTMVESANVRGVQVSRYGVPRLVNDRTGF